MHATWSERASTASQLSACRFGTKYQVQIRATYESLPWERRLREGKKSNLPNNFQHHVT